MGVSTTVDEHHLDQVEFALMLMIGRKLGLDQLG